MNRYQLIHETLWALEAFQNDFSVASHDLKSFATWIQNQNKTFENNSVEEKKNENLIESQKFYQYQNKEIQIGSILTTLNKFSKHYTKKAFENTPIKTIEEFGFLAPLAEQKSMSKTELIQLNLLELPTGMEIIRRLQRHGLLEETPDPYDKRAKQLALSQLGRNVIIEIFEEMRKVAQIIAGNLSEDEKTEFITIMLKLKQFHLRIYKMDRISEIDSILEKYIKKEV